MDPELKIIENFISEDDCNYYINTYKDNLQRSTMMFYKNNQRTTYINENRTSTSYYIPRNEVVSSSLQSKVADLLQVDINRTDDVQLSRYEKGQQFKPHHDFIANATNQREYTVIIYLNNLNETDGGKTEFPLCNISITPKIGRLIWFKNCYPDGHRMMRSLHAGGEILTDAVKYILTIFVRQRPFER
jgi:prolyl 4-hydroxylase